ncbi:MAG: uracil-DNA glycosylase [Actinomycetota bacterium]|jgi:DNA polymerase|nr:uracil-DNA glycosylase [Actinomycetota bacterium]
MDMPTISLTMEELAEKIRDCQKCPLSQTRKKAVPGEGSHNSVVMFVGEAPGGDEDREGLPFIGRAGQLFTRILQSVQIERKDVFITNIVKCRPPQNRNPNKSEIEICLPYLESQIALINPRIIVTLGSVPTKCLLNTDDAISRLRGQWFPWLGGIKIFPMFHPSYLLRHQEATPGSPKELTWRDIQELKRMLSKI